MQRWLGKPIFEHRLYGGEEVSFADIWGKTILGRRNNQGKVRRMLGLRKTSVLRKSTWERSEEIRVRHIRDRL